MTLYSTSFSEYTPDAAPSDFTSQFLAPATGLKVRRGMGDLYSRLHVTGPAEDFGLHTWDVVDGDTTADDVEILACRSLRSMSSNQDSGTDWIPLFGWRTSGSAGSETGYYLTIDRSPAPGEMRLRKLVAGTDTNLSDPALVDPEGSLGTVLWIHVLSIGSNHKVRWWVDGATEPTTWTINKTDSAITAAGGVGVMSFSTSEVQEWLYFAVATGATAEGDVLEPSEHGPSANEIANNPETKIEWTFEVNSRQLDTADKTDYFTTKKARRTTNAGDLPASKIMEGRLLAPESQAGTVGVAGDMEFGEAPEATVVKLMNNPTAEAAAGPSDSWSADRSFAGRNALVRVGSRDAATHRSFTPMWGGPIDGEPEAAGGLVRLSLNPHATRLQRTLDVNRHVGIPRCLRQMDTSSSGTVTFSHISAYDLTSYTLSAWVRFEAAVSATARIFYKSLSGTDRNYYLFVDSSRRLRFSNSAAGVSNVSIIVSDTGVDDGDWHEVVLSLEASVYAYLMMDGKVIGEDSSIGTPDTQTVDVTCCALAPSGMQLALPRIIGRYMTPDEARGLTVLDPTAVPSDYELYCTEETTGTTWADHSSNANDGTVSGTEDTHFEWFETNLGEAEMAGEPMPIRHGDVVHAETQLIDRTEERYRLADRARIETGTSRLTYEEGDGTGSWSYFEDNAVVEPNSAIDEPITARFYNTSSSLAVPDIHPGDIAQEVLTQRGGFVEADFAMDSIERGRELFGYRGGWGNDGEPPSAESALQDILGPFASWRFDGYARLVFDQLLPPVAPGPEGTACVEFLGTSYDTGTDVPELVWGDVADLGTTDCTLFCWFKPLAPTHRDYGNVVMTNSKTRPGERLIEHQHSLGLQDPDGQIFFQAAGLSVESMVAPVLYDPGAWYFVAGVYDQSAGTRNIYIAKDGDSLRLIGAQTGLTGTSTEAGDVLKVGGADQGDFSGRRGYVGGMQWAGAIGDALNLAALQALMDNHATTATSNIKSLVGFTEGQGHAIELVSDTPSPLVGAQWAPRLQLDLDDGETSVKLDWIRRLLPRRGVRLNYQPNMRKLERDQIAASVWAGSFPGVGTQITSDGLTQELLYTAEADEEVDARMVEVNSWIMGGVPFGAGLGYGNKEAVEAANYLARRFVRRRFMKLSGLDRRGLGLIPFSEVWVKWVRHGLSAGKSFRVVGMPLEGVHPKTGDPMYSLRLVGDYS